MPQDLEDCVDALDGQEGIDNPYALCNWMKGEGYKLPGSGGSVSEAQSLAQGEAFAAFSANMENQDEIDQGKRQQGPQAKANGDDSPLDEAAEPGGPVHDERDENPKKKRGAAAPGSKDPGDKQRSLVPKRVAKPKVGTRPPQAKAGPGEFSVSWLAKADAEVVPLAGPLQRAFPKARSVNLKGDFIDTTVNENRWGVPANELAAIAQQLASGGVQVRLDHAEEVGKVVGLYDGGQLFDVDGDPISFDASDEDLARAVKVGFSATITLTEENVAIPILMGYVRGVSPNLTAGHVECGVCGKAAFPEPTCAHFDSVSDPGYFLLRDVKVKEGSIVATPAYGERTNFLPIGFAASVTKKIEEMKTTMAERAGATGGGEVAQLVADNERLKAELQASKDAELRAYRAASSQGGRTHFAAAGPQHFPGDGCETGAPEHKAYMGGMKFGLKKGAADAEGEAEGEGEAEASAATQKGSPTKKPKGQGPQGGRGDEGEGDSGGAGDGGSGEGYSAQEGEGDGEGEGEGEAEGEGEGEAEATALRKARGNIDGGFAKTKKGARAPSAKDRIAATRQGAKAGTETKQKERYGPPRQWGAMAGTINDRGPPAQAALADTTTDWKALRELKAVAEGKLQKGLEPFTGSLEDLMRGYV